MVEAFGPEPDAELVHLAHQAEADATTLQDESAQALRNEQAQQLYDEIIRVCGVDPEGQPPDSCVIDTPNEATGAESLADAGESLARFVAEEHEKLPPGSLDLVVAQAVDTLAASDPTLPEAAPMQLSDESDLHMAREMLEHEYAVQYGLGLASAFADDALQERIDAIKASASDRISYLHEMGIDVENGSAVAAGYQLQGFPDPTTTEEASALVSELNTNLVDEWRLTAARATFGDWRYAALYLAAHAQGAA